MLSAMHTYDKILGAIGIVLLVTVTLGTLGIGPNPAVLALPGLLLVAYAMFVSPPT